MSNYSFNKKIQIQHSQTFITDDSIEYFVQKNIKRFRRNSSNTSLKKIDLKDVKSDYDSTKQKEQKINVKTSYIKLNNILKSPVPKVNSTHNISQKVQEQKKSQFDTITEQRIKRKEKEIKQMQEQKKKLKIRIKQIENENYQLHRKQEKTEKQKLQLEIQNNKLKIQIQKLQDSNSSKDKLIQQILKINKIKEQQINKLKVENQKMKRQKTISVKRIGQSKLQSFKQISLQREITILKRKIKTQKGINQLELQKTIQQLQCCLNNSKQYIKTLQIRNNILEKKNMTLPDLTIELDKLKKEAKNKSLVIKGYYQQLKQIKRQNKKLNEYVRQLQTNQLTFSLNSQRQYYKE